MLCQLLLVTRFVSPWVPPATREDIIDDYYLWSLETEMMMTMTMTQPVIKLPDVSNIMCRLPSMHGWQGCRCIHMRNLVASMGCRSKAMPRKGWQRWTLPKSRVCGGIIAWHMAEVSPGPSLQ